MDSASAAAYVVFDLLARNGKDLRNRPYWKRRRKLEKLLGGHLPDGLVLIPATADRPWPARGCSPTPAPDLRVSSRSGSTSRTGPASAAGRNSALASPPKPSWVAAIGSPSTRHTRASSRRAASGRPAASARGRRGAQVRKAAHDVARVALAHGADSPNAAIAVRRLAQQLADEHGPEFMHDVADEPAAELAEASAAMGTEDEHDASRPGRPGSVGRTSTAPGAPDLWVPESRPTPADVLLSRRLAAVHPARLRRRAGYRRRRATAPT
jgi:hypothetical protein